jgi:hypothetical protein
VIDRGLDHYQSLFFCKKPINNNFNLLLGY